MASHMTKHIDIRHHYTRELVDAHTIVVNSGPASDMPSDGETKALSHNPSTPCSSSYASGQMTNTYGQ
jgi:hypothetical protein